MLVVIGEDAERITDLLEAHALALKLRAYVLEHPRARVRPVDFAAFRIKLPPVLGDKSDADEIDGERLCDKLGVDPVFFMGRALRGRGLHCKADFGFRPTRICYALFSNSRRDGFARGD